MGRLLALVGGVAWLGAIALIALAYQWSEQPRSVPRLSTLPPLLQQLNTAPREGQSWLVTRATSAHHVLVVEVTADRLDDSRAVATQIVETTAGRGYEEVLIYVWRTRPRKTFADRRVQWTPNGGFTELKIGDE
jgi:hypothetical protein